VGGYWLYLLSMLIIGARQRAIASLLHEATQHAFQKQGAVNIYSRNRYAGLLERIFIGAHGDSYHLTHHLLPGVRHWNLRRATGILCEDSMFRSWDQTWCGIFSSRNRGRISFIQYVLNEREFKRHVFSHTLTQRAPKSMRYWRRH
jgi:fatty acid desaturase